MTMSEPEFQLLDDIEIDSDRQFIEFRFSDCSGVRKVIQIDFNYLETLAAVFQQAFLSATLESQQGPNKHIGQDWIAVPRADIDHPVSVGIDAMSGRIIAMFLLGSPFQVCYALPHQNARMLSQDLLTAAEEIAKVADRPLN